jgi:phage shock protein E
MNLRVFTSTLLAGLGCALFTNCVTAAENAAHTRVSVEQFDKLWKEQKLPILDVRRDVEYEEGHIPGALNIDIYSPDFQEQVAKLDKSRPWLVHCRSGGRSARACKIMSDLGFTKLYDLAPGMMGWRKAGKQVEEGPARPAK